MNFQKTNNVVQHFLSASQRYPSNTAIIQKGKRISYQQLANEVKSTAAYFTKKGIEKGDRVLVFVPMSIDLYRTVLALFYIGATAVFLDEWVSKERLLLCCRLAKCKGFIGTYKARFLSYFAKDLRAIPIKLSLRKRIKTTNQPSNVIPETSALITFTTGSTGTPKAADRSHDFLNEQFQVLKTKINSKPGDVEMTALPIVLFINLGVGATSIIPDYNSRKPNTIKQALIIKQIQANKVQRIISSPFFIKKIAAYIKEKKLEIPSLQEIYTGGAPVFPSEARLYQEAFPNVDINIIYGSTEAEPISSITTKDLIANSHKMAKGLAVGSIHQKIHLRIIPLDNQKLERISRPELDNITLDNNTIGEILVAGKHVLKRYFNNPGAFRKNKIVVDGEIWHRTGDSGYLEDGKLFLTGRCNQLIKKNDQIISPFVIENYVSQIPSVDIGTLVDCKNELTLVLETNELAHNISRHLDSITYDRLVIVDKIPRDPRHNSKIDYGELKRKM